MCMDWKNSLHLDTENIEINGSSFSFAYIYIYTYMGKDQEAKLCKGISVKMIQWQRIFFTYQPIYFFQYF